MQYTLKATFATLLFMLVNECCFASHEDQQLDPESNLFAGRCERRGCFFALQQMFLRDPIDGGCENRCVLFSMFAKRQGWECGTCGDETEVINMPDKFNTRLDIPDVSQAVEQAFAAAAARWDSVIAGDIPAYDARDIQGFSKCTRMPQLVDDTYICIEVKEIDGVGGILGRANSEFIRGDSGLPISGRMFFDAADVEHLLSRGKLENVIMHEMGHIFGISSASWTRRGITSQCVYDPDLRASQEWQNITGCPSTVPIPVEAKGGTGTACSHWEEKCLKGEVMSGYLSGGMQISRMTIAALEDLGYDVNYDAADSFGLNHLGRNCVKTLCSEEQERRLGEPISGLDDLFVDEDQNTTSEQAAWVYGQDVLEEEKANWMSSSPSFNASESVGSIQSERRDFEYVADQFVSVIYEDGGGEVRALSVSRT